MRAEQVSKAQIAVHRYSLSPTFIGQVNASDPMILERFSELHFPERFKEYADLLTWRSRASPTSRTVRDVSTLANPKRADDIRHYIQSVKLARGDVPRELTPEEAEEVKAFGQSD